MERGQLLIAYRPANNLTHETTPSRTRLEKLPPSGPGLESVCKQLALWPVNRTASELNEESTRTVVGYFDRS